MELIDRYLHAVKFWLPRAQQEDIAAELSADIQAQVEERAAGLERTLTDAEVAAILKELGRPMLVANRYLPQRYLIGPALFPTYVFTLKVVTLCCLVPMVLNWIGLWIFHPFYHRDTGALIGLIWGTFWIGALVIAGIITLIFSSLERVQGAMDQWDPLKLPPARDPNRIPRTASIFELAASLLFIAWFMNSMWSFTIFDREGVRIVLTPVWRSFFWASLSASAGYIALSIYNLFRPYWTRLRCVVRLVLDLAGASIFCWLLRANILAEIRWPQVSPERTAAVTQAINLNMAKAFPLVVITCLLIIALVDVGRIVRLKFNRPQFAQRLAVFLVLAVMTTGARAQTPVASSALFGAGPSDAEIRELLVDHVDVQHLSVGTVVGIVTPQGKRVVSYGLLNQGDPRRLDGDTVFEIGSITKIFTALLLSDMAQRGEVALNDPVAKYLSSEVRIPETKRGKITLADLATHTSGLPTLPSNLPGANDLPNFTKYAQEIANYSDSDLRQFLSAYQLEHDPGTHWQYSNLGYGLLGKALAGRAGMSYEEMVHKRITGPLGMASTAITVSPQMKARLGVGHDARLQPAPDWSMAEFAAAGSLRSSANDLLALLAVFLGYTKSALTPAMASMLETRRLGPGFGQALGWWVIPVGPTDEVVLFGGETYGYASTIAYDPKSRVGVVVLSNGSANDGGIGLHLLRPAFPVATAAAKKAAQERKEIAVDPKILDRYVGRYKPAVGEIGTVERQGDGLLLKSATAPQGLRLHAESERSFFIKGVDLCLTFQVDSEGRATAVIYHFAGADTPAPRIEDETIKPK